MSAMEHHGERPRTVGPWRAAAILYGDWGTSKAYVLGIAFGLAGYSSFPLLVAMGVLTALVGLNYFWVCRQYPDGGGVYSAVRDRSRMIATVGALLLIADYLVTASLSVLEGFNYISHLLDSTFGFALPMTNLWAAGLIVALGFVNWHGSRHSGTLAVALAVPATLAAVSLAFIAAPHLGDAHFELHERTFGQNWIAFAGIVLALSGVEAVSNMTGIMTADRKPVVPGHSATVSRTAGLAIFIVALEVVGLMIVLGWAMHAMPGLERGHIEAMLGQMATHYGQLAFGATAGKIYAIVVGIVIALLLFSAGNTAINGMISVFYMMSKDREMPAGFRKLNRHGVPINPLIVSVALCASILFVFTDTQRLAALYAIGVVGAITINLGACTTNRKLSFSLPVRVVMGATSLVMLCIWITVAIEKHEALAFAATILLLGLFARSFVEERREVAEEKEIRAMLSAHLEVQDDRRPGEGRLLVTVGSVTPTLGFAMEEARFRNARLGILFVREVRTMIPAGPELVEDRQALEFFDSLRPVTDPDKTDFLYRQDSNVADAVIDCIREYKPDVAILGARAGKGIARLFQHSIANEVARQLPASTRLLVYTWQGDAPRPSGAKNKKQK